MQRYRSGFICRHRRALTRRERTRSGAAMVEATIALPVFIVLLIGATYLRDLYIARASTRLTARSCAWEYALEGCTGSTPAQCSSSIGSAHDGRVPNIAETVRAAVGNADDPFRDVPIVRDALAGLFGSSTSSAASATVPFPFDRARVGVATAQTTVVCNSVATEVLSIAKDLLCDHVPC